MLKEWLTSAPCRWGATPDDYIPYQPGQQLLVFRRFYGAEQRDILMLWRNRSEVYFAEGHERQPGGIGRVRTNLCCQHYGKSLSVEHWEETCDYYIKHFPFQNVRTEMARPQRAAIHSQSDFMRPLYEWGDALFANAVRI
jgi:hypothetical protein